MTTKVSSTKTPSFLHTLRQSSCHYTLTDSCIAEENVSSGVARVTEPVVKIFKQPLPCIFMITPGKKCDVCITVGDLCIKKGKREYYHAHGTSKLTVFLVCVTSVLRFTGPPKTEVTNHAKKKFGIGEIKHIVPLNFYIVIGQSSHYHN